MQRKENLHKRVHALYEKIEEIEVYMKNIDSTNVNVEAIKPIAERLGTLISNVMGMTNDKVWNLGYALDYDKVLDYVMNRDSSLTSLEVAGLVMLELPLNIIDAWIQLVRMIFDLYFPSWSSSKSLIVNGYLDVLQRTVDIMRRIILAAKVKSSGPTYQHRNALSAYESNIITNVREVMAPFKHTRKHLPSALFNAHYPHSTNISQWVPCKYIVEFMSITFIDKVEERLDTKINPRG